MSTRARTDLLSAGRETTNAGRYSFIDVLRACAASVVLFQHGGEGAGWFSPDVGFGPWINFGQVGVLTFFLVSGFVIPLSLERAGSIKTFWKHRLFRIYPLYVAVLAYEIFAYFCGYGSSATSSVKNWPFFLTSHLLLVQEYIRQPHFVGQSWTLSLEFAWYGLLSLALLTKLNKKSILITAVAIIGLLSLSTLSLTMHVRIPIGRFGIMASCVAGLLFYRLHNKELQPRVSGAYLYCCCCRS
ncbi:MULTISPECIES: acyltransferase family protein [Paraburkholderia]|uniref:Peptidoglycan/LPS O-acetylase OafA/YrhL n=2 Tax=Paraburkholderia TaxID=1822464 RepID=A0A7Z0BA11_9BURK|nr:acyltransferase [Paraburkholderia bryophila]NYH25848.1 peptidoglycan/LPS O-acetylase OafA/YrhL [Paraburkholderia bryophila]